jgi:AraC family transcriptional regulator
MFMPMSGIEMLDPGSKRPVQVIPASCVALSNFERERGPLIVERHVLDDIESPEFEIPQYSVIVQLSAPANLEDKINGRFKLRQSLPKSVCIFTAGAPRQFRTSEHLDVIAITLDKSVIDAAARALHLKPNVNLIEKRGLNDAAIAHIAMALMSEVEQSHPSGLLYSESLGLALASTLVSKYAGQAATSIQFKGGLSPFALNRVVDYIHTHLSEDLCLEDLATVAGLSQYRFAHNFKNATGMAPHQYVIRQRVEKAKELLRETDQAATVIAYEIGCNSQSRFASLFRQVTGITPSQYRASFR